MRTLLISLLLGGSALAETQLQGRVKEKIDSAGYSYLQLETATGAVWAAVPQVSTVKVGDQVTVTGQNLMEKFESKTLKRTFDRVWFGTLGGLAPPPAPADSSIVEGKVLEQIDTPTYSYLRLSTSAGETWAAVMRTEPRLGKAVRVVNASRMDGFSSPSLKRTFEKIVFGVLEGATAAPSAPAPPPDAQPAPQPIKAGWSTKPASRR